MHPKDILIEDYNYHLPDESIAKYPLQKRDESKLLIYKNGVIAESFYKNLDEFLPNKTLMIFNNTKVVEARILFEKSTGGIIEIFCLEPSDIYKDITSAMLTQQRVYWKCLVGGAKKWKEEWLVKKLNNLELKAKIAERKNDYFLIEFVWDTNTSFAEVLHEAGLIPLPPYLNRNAEAKDAATYQTVYAKHDGSVAAPTAGLHFTDELLNRLANKNITTSFVTLHVGAGTFKPVKSEKLQDHEMHSEFIDVEINFIEQLVAEKYKTIIAVGTTSLRTIESLYWMGVKLCKLIDAKCELATIELNDLLIEQWDVYELSQNGSKTTALSKLIDWMRVKQMERIICKTQILIAPPYQLKVADGLVTNFHQPQSTLLLLISSIVGKDWQKIYQYALNNHFRFLSYGDGSLLWK